MPTFGYYGSNYLHDGNSGTDPTEWAKWTPNIPQAGEYEIYMRWTASSNRPDAAPIEIKYNGGTDTSKTINQQQSGGQWVLVGTYALSAGTGNYVKVIASDNGYTIADAVKFVQAVTVKHYYANGQRIATCENGVLTFIHSDHLGSASKTSNTSGALVQALWYDPWGTWVAGSMSSKYTYTGKEKQVD